MKYPREKISGEQNSVVSSSIMSQCDLPVYNENEYSEIESRDSMKELFSSSGGDDQQEDCVLCVNCASHPKINLLLFVVCYIGFMLFGAHLLLSPKKNNETNLKLLLLQKQETFLQNHPSVDAEDLNRLIEYVTRLQFKGINWEPVRRQDPLSHRPFVGCYGHPASADVYYNITTVRPAGGCNWDFTSSLLFVTSLVTTIGYGHVSPLTDVGKLLTIVFSAAGIPLTLTLLSTTGSLLLRGPARRLETWMAVITTRIYRTATVFFIRLTHLILLTLILLCLCFFIPAYFFSSYEKDWSYLDAIYYCYISLTTIGLGDLIPATGNPEIPYYRLTTVAYLYFGLTLIMLWLALIYRIPQFDVNHLLLSKDSVPSSNYYQNPKEGLRILTPHSPKIMNANGTPSTSRSSLSKSYGTQNNIIPSSP